MISVPCALTWPNPGYGQSDITEVHKPMDQMGIWPWVGGLLFCLTHAHTHTLAWTWCYTKTKCYKCGALSIEFLGHCVQPLPSTVAASLGFPSPRDCQETSNHLNMINFLQGCLPAVAKTMRSTHWFLMWEPARNRPHHKEPWVCWGLHCLQASPPTCHVLSPPNHRCQVKSGNGCFC